MMAFAFFLLFLAGIALVNLGGRTGGDRPSAQPLSSDDLLGRSWRLAALRDHPEAAASGIELQFTKGGLLTVNGACNHASGRYALDATSLRFDEFAMTKMACAESAMRTDDALLAALAQTTSGQAEGAQLVFVAADGTRLARFRAVTP